MKQVLIKTIVVSASDDWDEKYKEQVEKFLEGALIITLEAVSTNFPQLTFSLGE